MSNNQSSCTLRYQEKLKKYGATIYAQAAHFWTLKDVKVVSFQQYVDTKQLHDSNNKYIESMRVEGYTLYMYEDYYPIAIEKEGEYIEGELWEVTYDTLLYITLMETKSGYIPIAKNNMIIYIQDNKYLEHYHELGSFYTV